MAGDRKSRQSRGSKRESAPKFKKWAAKEINDGKARTPHERCKLIAKLVRRQLRYGAPEWAAWEAIAAVVTNSQLESQGGHIFDLSREEKVGGKDVMEDGKYSAGDAGYAEGNRSKARKIRHAKQNPDRIPGSLVLSKRHGVYLHVGIDPHPTPAFKTEAGNESNRGVVDPEELGKRIDGSGDLIPFVKLSDRFKTISAWKRVTPADLEQIAGRRESAYRGINMEKAKKHFAKQQKAAMDETRQIIAEDDPEETVRAGLKAAGRKKSPMRETRQIIAEDDPEETAAIAAGVDADAALRGVLKTKGFSDEQIKKFLAMKPEKSS
jgi:hypothetical protein